MLTKIGSFCGLRVLAIALIVYFHATKFYWMGDWVARFVPGLLMFFFCVSGFLQGLQNRFTRVSLIDSIRYLVGKIIVFYPIFALSMILSRKLWSGPTAWSVSPWWHFLLLQSWNPVVVEEFSVASWFLSTLLFLYFAVSLLLPILQRLSCRTLFVALSSDIILTGALSVFWARKDVNLRYALLMFPPSALLPYIGATIVGVLRGRGLFNELERMARTFVTLLELGVIALWVFLGLLPQSWAHETTIWLLPTYLGLLIFSYDRGYIAAFLGSRPFTILASLIMPVYLLHGNVLNFVTGRLDETTINALTTSWRLAGYFGCLFLTASVAWIYTTIYGWCRKSIRWGNMI